MTPDESRAVALLALRYRRQVRDVTEWRLLPAALRTEGERLFTEVYARPVTH